MKGLEMSIVPYQEKYHQAFIDLNMHWLEKYFEAELYDKKQLTQCQKMIIDPGGCIFIGIVENKPIGTYALVKIDQQTTEFSKMAIDVNYQGNGFGKQLMEHSIGTAKKMNFQKLVLYTHCRLERAIHIYKKFGFQTINVESNCPYERCNKKMELDLALK
ncbi:MAG: GNAT family N-acetyltransferase [Flavobacteriaceae bacterium]|nr:GNAT family N-acetyltransferase [Flavobacteriaceae bacterium]